MPRFLVLLFVAVLVLPARSAAAAEPLKPGARIESLAAGATVYRDVVVRSVSARTVMITHAGGMASLRLRDLAPEWQERFQYDPAAEAAAEAAARAAAPVAAAPKRSVKAPTTKKDPGIDQLLQQFGQPATVQPEVNLRPRFAEMGLGVRDQGRRPSCSIFAIVCALEYQNARLTGRAQNFSEEYVIWATRKTVQRLPSPAGGAGSPGDEDADAGFSLTEVVTALRAYGIPYASSLPNHLAGSIAAIQDPPPQVIEEARAQQQVFVHPLPGRDTKTRINNLVHALNAGMPVAIGLAWPNYRALRTGYLSGQKPMENAWHAVTVVGYRANGPRLEDTYFIFKNSWGANWGQGGYGTVTFDYLNQHLADAVLLEVQKS
ncbi:MAG: C1 family peptidase [Opitutaceae bacterium]|nr:C1 family peptidase [Opitutaceae bacterium]